MPEQPTPRPSAVDGGPDHGSEADPDTLPCGVPLAVLVDQADAGRLEPADAHQARCPHCRQALRTAATVDQALGLLRSTTGPVPAGLVDRVMRRVRHARQDSAAIELSAADRDVDLRADPGTTRRTGQGAGRLLTVGGGIRVRRQVVADIARAAATTVRGVTVARAAAAPQPGAPGAVRVSLGLLVDGRTPLPELARRLRQAVRAAVGRALGAGEVEVELTALDLLDPE